MLKMAGYVFGAGAGLFLLACGIVWYGVLERDRATATCFTYGEGANYICTAWYDRCYEALGRDCNFDTYWRQRIDAYHADFDRRYPLGTKI